MPKALSKEISSEKTRLAGEVAKKLNGNNDLHEAIVSKNFAEIAAILRANGIEDASADNVGSLNFSDAARSNPRAPRNRMKCLHYKYEVLWDYDLIHGFDWYVVETCTSIQD
jgi:hypothetical protein